MLKLRFFHRYCFVSIIIAVALSGLFCNSAVQAQFPGLFGRKAAAENSADYPLSAQQGPWLITAFVFTGKDASQYAQKLCTELRRDYKLTAYTYNKKIKEEDRVVGRGFLDENGQVKMMRHMKDPNVDAYVVFVGNFSAVDDNNAQNTLTKVRQLKPKCLQYHGDFNAENPLAEDFAAHGIKPGYGPMGRAFLTRNPIIVESEPTNNALLDSKVVGFNKNVKYSLLDCPGKYSVQIGTYRGFRTINQGEIEKIRKTGEVKSDKMMTLAEADQAAERLTLALRKKGIEAYCFRDHYASIVTVGSFNEISVINPQTGKEEAIPAIQQIYQQYSATQDPSKGMGPESIQLKVISDIPLDPAPMIINVPRAPRTASTGFWSR